MAQLDINTDLFNYAETLGISELHIVSDAKVGLQGIIAIHNTNRGPALGGCRLAEYATVGDAFKDAMRLAEGMTYKAAMANLPFGGGKTVLCKPTGPIDRSAYFARFGEFIQHLNGRYITAEDSGTSPYDMDSINKSTHYVAGTSRPDGTTDDPSPYTALGTFYGMRAAVEHMFGKDDFQGLHVAIQGIGSVGYKLAALLHEKGARLTVSDRNPEATQKAAREFGANIVDISEIHRVDCDIFSPCAFGSILNDHSIPELNTKIIAGCANNQLERAHHGELLLNKGILYAPDYVTNAGGLIYVGCLYNKTFHQIDHKLQEISLTLHDIFACSAKEKTATNHITDRLAKERVFA